MIVRISQGLGNQMFQYAFAKALEQEEGIRHLKLDLCAYSNSKVPHNGYELERIFQIQEDYCQPRGKWFKCCERVLKRLARRFHNPKLQYLCYFNCITDSDLIHRPRNAWGNFEHRYLFGYWQSEAYFAGAAKQIRRIFTFPPFQTPANLSLQKRIENTQSVSVHVRRGDYITYSDKFVRLDQTDYYIRAIGEIQKRVANPVFFVFSNDIQWCRQNLPLPENAVYVDWNTGADSYRDMQLMSLCRHNIIANSTFSWWGAWLNPHEDKIVIAPEKFFVRDSGSDDSGFVPESWLKLAVDS